MKFLLGFICFLVAQSAHSATYETMFQGKDAVSPRLVVELFSPWASDNYPSLIRSVDLFAVGKHKNRLYCEKKPVKKDKSITCQTNGENWSYEFLGLLANGIYAFRTVASATQGTLVQTCFRFFRIEETTQTDLNGKTTPMLLMSLMRDIPIPDKTVATAAISEDSKIMEITTERFPEKRKAKIQVKFD